MSTAVRKRRHTKVAVKSLPRIVSRLSERHDYQVVRASLVTHWLNSNPMPKRPLENCKIVERSLNSHNDGVVDELSTVLASQVGPINIKDLECGFESLMGRQNRQSQGAVYTPNFIIDYLVENASSMTSRKISKMKLCDPACGSGGFLIRAAIHFAKLTGKPLTAVFEENLVGFDNDPLAIENAGCLIELFLAHNEQHLSNSSVQVLHADTLLDAPEGLLNLSNSGNPFDVVTTNPPFVKLQNLSADYRQRLIERYAEFIKGSFSLAPLFLIAGHRLLAPGGCLAYITQNNLFTSLSGQPIRRYLQHRKCVRRILDFRHAKVFDNASAYTCLLFLGSDEHDKFEFDTVDPPVTRETLQQATFSSIDASRLDPRKWRLAKGRQLRNLERIENTGRPLGKVAKIRVGFATLRDSVFFACETQQGCFAKSETGEFVPIERGCTRRAVKVADVVNDSQITRNSSRIIFPYYQTSAGFQVLPEADLCENFPQAYEHLSNNRSLLEARDKGKANPDGWYAWGRSQSREALGPKLLTKTFNNSPNFMLDCSDQLFCNGYSVSLIAKPPVTENMSLDVLARILNSRIMHYYAKLTSFHIEGGYQCYQKNFIESFGIPELSLDEREEFLNLSDLEANKMLACVYQIPWEDIVQYVPS